MALAIVTICDVVTRDVMRGDNARSESITTSGVAVSGAMTARAGQIAQVFCDTGLYARCGGAVAQATGVYCPPGVATYIAMVEGVAISLIDA